MNNRVKLIFLLESSIFQFSSVFFHTSRRRRRLNPCDINEHESDANAVDYVGTSDRDRRREQNNRHRPRSYTIPMAYSSKSERFLTCMLTDRNMHE